MGAPEDDAGRRPDFPAFVRYWLQLGCLSFGGPAGQIAMMQAELVDRRRWIDQTRFLHALNFCMLLPGPEAQQLATYIGWRLYGIGGGLVAGGLFVLPGALVLLGLSWLAAAGRGVPAVTAVFYGVKPVVVAIIIAAVWRIGRRTLKGVPGLMLAVAAFLGLYVWALPFPLIVLAAAITGIAASLAGQAWFGAAGHGPIPESGLPAGPAPSLGRLARLAGLFVLLWAVPVVAAVGLLGQTPYAAIATLFTKAAFVTFGGAYAVLPFIADAAVNQYAWLAPADMINGLALAESTPGPLILVTQYVGFFAGWNHALANPGGLAPGLAGSLGALLTLYVTFLPCFLFIFAGAPYVERLIHNRTAGAALGAVTTAVVGVILNLGVFLAVQVLWLGDRGLDRFAGLLALLALAALLIRQVPMHWLVVAGALAGLAEAGLTGTL